MKERINDRYTNKEVHQLHQGKPQDYIPMFGVPIGDWFRVFAWKPLYTADRGKVWLRFVWRRRIAKLNHLPGGADFWFQYVVRK